MHTHVTRPMPVEAYQVIPRNYENILRMCPGVFTVDTFTGVLWWASDFTMLQNSIENGTFDPEDIDDYYQFTGRDWIVKDHRGSVHVLDKSAVEAFFLEI